MGSEKSLSLESYDLFILINAYCFCSYVKGDSRWATVLHVECTWAINTKKWVFYDLLWVNAFTNDIFARVMASNTVNGL